MEITVREFRSEDTKEAIAIWNEVVDQGKAFPQLEDLGVEDGEAFFKEQSYTGIAVNENDEIVGLYILHPNNIGRCGHICNASYAVKSTVSNPLVAHHSSASDNRLLRLYQNGSKTPEM